MGKKSKKSVIKILSLDGSQIYKAMYSNFSKPGMEVYKGKKTDFTMFEGCLDNSLDIRHLESIYHSYSDECVTPRLFFYEPPKKGKNNTSTDKEERKYTLALVNVSFEYSTKEFEKYGDTYYRYGWLDRVKSGEVPIENHVAIADENGKDILVAVQVVPKSKKKKLKYVSVPEDDVCTCLDEFFKYEEFTVKDSEGKEIIRYGYAPEKDIDNKIRLAGKNEIRKKLYEKGFYIDSVHYVRYKRSAGSSREGHCLFIAEPLLAPMMEWSRCGLTDEDKKRCSLASYEAYISLTLSNNDKSIYLPKKSILLLKDYEDECFLEVVSVGDNLDSIVCEKKIKNKIWDGEALLDRSVFEENEYGDKGMMLLRNRFLKTCAFNTNLQDWFRENGVTRIDQLNGYYAKGAKVEDIKLVITVSSLKYLKFRPKGADIGEWFRKWIDNALPTKEDCYFGVVKTDKERGPMNGSMARTNYQLLNSLDLSEDEVRELLRDSEKFLEGLQKDPKYVRYYSGLFGIDNDNLDELDDDELDKIPRRYRQAVVERMTRLSDDFCHTEFYKEYKKALCNAFRDKLKRGVILVEGAYHTLFGNGLELLYSTVKERWNGECLALNDGEIYTKRFANGERLLGERSPHITMGNLYIAKNKYVPEIDKYFNLGRNIVVINAIGSNIQHRLNGCDYDSDTMLLTNNPILLGAAEKHYDEFLVPYCEIKTDEKKDGGSEDFAALDIEISNNKVGEIVNLSQMLNSIYWEWVHQGRDKKALDGLYLDICKLAVFSGLEIDKAKKPYDAQLGTLLGDLHKRYKEEIKECKAPWFFYMTKKREPSGEEKKKLSTSSFRTAMAYVYDTVKKFERADRVDTIPYREMFDLVMCPDRKRYAVTKQKDSILKEIRDKYAEISKINRSLKYLEYSAKANALEKVDEIFWECCLYVEQKVKIDGKISDDVYRLLLDRLDELTAAAKKGADKSDDSQTKNTISSRALAFAALLFAEVGYLIHRVKNVQGVRYDLKQCDGEDGASLTIFGHPFRLVECVKKAGE